MTNPIKVIKNVSGLTYDELESNLKAVGIEIRATTLANRYKSTSSHTKMTVEEKRLLSNALTARETPKGAEQLVEAFQETLIVMNELLGTSYSPFGNSVPVDEEQLFFDDNFDDDLDSVDDDFDDILPQTKPKKKEEPEEELDWDSDDWDSDDWDFEDGDDDDWGDFEPELEEKPEPESEDEDDLLSLILDDEVPEVPETEEDNLFSVLESDNVAVPSSIPSTPENFENQGWLTDGDEFDVENAKI